VLVGSWAKALATATPVGAAFLVGGVAFPLALSSKGENLAHYGRAMVASLMSLPS
jgi:hypothetical protein